VKGVALFAREPLVLVPGESAALPHRVERGPQCGSAPRPRSHVRCVIGLGGWQAV